MKAAILLPLLFFILVACAPKQYANDNPTANWERDSNQCNSYALGNSPMPVYQAPEMPQTTYGSGIISGSDGPISYTYTQTTYPNNMQSSLNYMNNSIAAANRKEALYEMCLKNLGWYEISDGVKNRPQNNNKGYEICLEEYSTILPQQNSYNSVEVLIADLEKTCQQRTGGFIKNLASYYAHKVIK